MARFKPKPPLAGRNKFDVGMKKMAIWDNDYSGKMIRFEQNDLEHRRLGGCGDPNCEMCNPKDGLVGKAPGGSPRSSSLDMIRAMTRDQEALMRDAFSSSWSTTGTTSEARPTRDSEYEDAKEKVKDYLLETSHSTGWDDVIGNERARTALLEAIEHPIKHADLYKHYGMKLSKGVLLYGPPGCGKTMFGKAAASAMARLHGKKVELLVINGPSIQSPWVGKTEETIRDIFGYAREYKRVHGHQLVVFIDEADAILKARKGSPMWNASNVATFLTEMDGMENSGAFVILATNRPDELDEALLRDGRCDRKIKVERPSLDAALSIAGKELTEGAAWAQSVKPADLVEYLYDPTHLLQAITNPLTNNTHHFLLSHIVSGAMVVGLVNRAKGIAFRRDMASGTTSGLTAGDLKAAVDEVLNESKGLNHDYALREFVEDVAIPFEQAKALRGLN